MASRGAVVAGGAARQRLLRTDPATAPCQGWTKSMPPFVCLCQANIATQNQEGIAMKEFIEWSDALSVGVKEIADQHKGLINMLNELNKAIQGGWGKEARKEVIDKLIEYTRVHFTTEESVMSISGYPDVEAHKKQHENLIVMVNDYVKKYEQDPNASSYDLLFFLKRWLTEHIIKSDKTLGDYLVKTGPKTGGAKKSWFRRLFGL
jgi:hemerythrin